MRLTHGDPDPKDVFAVKRGSTARTAGDRHELGVLRLAGFDEAAFVVPAGSDRA